MVSRIICKHMVFIMTFTAEFLSCDTLSQCEITIDSFSKENEVKIIHSSYIIMTYTVILIYCNKNIHSLYVSFSSYVIYVAVIGS